MASIPTVTTASAGSFSPGVIQQKSVVDVRVLQDVQKKIQSFGPGPYTPEQAKEIESLKIFYHRMKTEHDKAMQEGKVQNVAVVRTTNVMTPVTQVLVPGHVAAPGSVQMAKIAPATTALPTQLTTVLPASKITSGVPVVKPAVTSTKTILPQTTLQQVQGHNVVINRANMQQLQMSGEVAQQKGTPSQATHLQVSQSPVRSVSPGQQITIRNVTQTLPVTQAVKTAATTSDRPLQGTQGTLQTVTLQRPLVQHSKSPVTMPITLAPSGTVSAAVPSGGHVVTNIAPAPVAAAATSKGLHSTAQTPGASLRGDSSSPAPNQVLTKRRLQDLLHEIDPREQMDDDVEDLLLQIADDFIESVVTASCQIAKHRRSNTLEVRDVQLHLERCWNMWIPGFGSDELRPFKKQATTEAHKQRMALIRKSMKK